MIPYPCIWWKVQAQVIQLCVVMYEIITFDTAHHMLIIFNIFVPQRNKLKFMFFLKSKFKVCIFFPLICGCVWHAKE